MLQKVPLYIASTEANLKDEIRKCIVSPTIVNTTTGSTSGARKRRLSKNTEQHSPSPSAAKRRRTHVDSDRTAQPQLPSPKSSRDSLLTEGGLSTANHHRSVGDALRHASRSASRSINTAQTPNPDQRPSMQPPTPRIAPATPSRTRSIALSDRTAQPISSYLSHKKERPSDVLVAPVPPNHPKSAFKAPNPFYIHTPLRTGSERPNVRSTRPSAPPPSSIGFSAVRYRLTRKTPYCPLLTISFFLLRSDEENASFRSPTTMMKFSMIDARKTVQCPRMVFLVSLCCFPSTPSRIPFLFDPMLFSLRGSARYLQCIPNKLVSGHAISSIDSMGFQGFTPKAISDQYGRARGTNEKMFVWIATRRNVGTRGDFIRENFTQETTGRWHWRSVCYQGHQDSVDSGALVALLHSTCQPIL